MPMKILPLHEYRQSISTCAISIITGICFGARAFAIAGPTVLNSLPDSLRDPAVGPDQFRRDLKTHLFE